MNALRAFLWRDFLRFRPLLALWILVLAAWALSASSREWADPTAMDRIMETLLKGMPLLMAALLVMADSPARRRLDLQARPVTRAAFVLTKGLGMLWMIVLPLMLAHAVVFWAHGSNPSLAARALGEMLVLVLARCAVAGGMAAMCGGVADWVRGAVVIGVSVLISIAAVRMDWAAQHYLAGPLLAAVGPMVSAPDLRLLLLLALSGGFFALCPLLCRRLGWSGAWARWMVASLAMAGALWLMSGTASMPSPESPPGGSGGVLSIGGPRDPQGNEERAWAAVDQALAEKIVREAELETATKIWGDHQAGQRMDCVVVGQSMEGLPPGVFVNWQCREQPRLSGTLAEAGWRLTGNLGAGQGQYQDFGSAAAIEILGGGRFGDGPAAPQRKFTGWGELGSLASRNGLALEGTIAFEASLTGRVWRWRLEKVLPENSTAEWRDESGEWRVEYPPFPQSQTWRRRHLVLAGPSHPDQCGLSTGGIAAVLRGGGKKKQLWSVRLSPAFCSSGWWEAWDFNGVYQGSAPDGEELLVFRLEFLGEAERPWRSGAVRFEKPELEEQPRNFVWPEFGSLKMEDYLADLERSRPDPATCGEEEVRRYLWKACQRLAFSRVTGREDMEKAARHLAPLAGKFRETFLLGWSRIGCWQNRLLKEALRQGLPEAEFKALNLPGS